jgi:hypothetical protein
MKQKHQSVFLAGLLALAVGLSACSSWRGGGTGSSGSSGAAGETGSSGMSGTGGGTGSSGSSGLSGAAGSSSGYDTSGSQGTSGMMQDQGAMSSKSPNATVAAIEVMPRSGSATTEGESSASAAMGSSSSGSTGSSPDRVYRVTLRMDDGSTQVVTQQTTPDFRTGDRVSLAGGAIQH